MRGNWGIQKEEILSPKIILFIASIVSIIFFFLFFFKKKKKIYVCCFRSSYTYYRLSFNLISIYHLILSMHFFHVAHHVIKIWFIYYLIFINYWGKMSKITSICYLLIINLTTSLLFSLNLLNFHFKILLFHNYFLLN